MNVWRRPSYDPIAYIIVGVAVVVAALAVWSTAYDALRCVRWETTGGTICHGGDGYMHCEPERVCAEYDDE